MGLEANIQGSQNFDKLEIVKAGVTSVSSDGSAVTETSVAHNLGYRPIVISFLNGVSLSEGGSTIYSDADIPLPIYGNLTATGGFLEFIEYIHAAVDNNNVYFIYVNAVSAVQPALPIKYYLFRERSA